jgi:hypothetical protein
MTSSARAVIEEAARLDTLGQQLYDEGKFQEAIPLWNVSDSSTRELMREFYRELARGTGRAEALRRAKLQLLHQPKFAHPYYWAAFIPAGDWTPLDSHLLKQ